MILVCGGIADPVTELVCARIDERGYRYCLLDLGMYPAGVEISWHWHGGRPSGYIATADWSLDLSEVDSVYVRYPDLRWRQKLPDMPEESAPAIYAECDAGLAALLECLPGLVVNRLQGGMSNHSKPFQALQIREHNLRIPLTLVTNDPQAALQFITECDGEAIYKSISSMRSIVRRVGPEQLKRLETLRDSPAQFQRFIPGDNVRVHTVGDQIFATLVRSDAVDYRYAHLDGLSVVLEAIDLPSDISSACLGLSRSLGLMLAGIDLKRTPESEYYCFEVNPSPAFIFYELGSGQEISSALADLLHEAQGRNPPRLDGSGWE